MNRLTVLYDARCGFCVRCRRWLEAQPRFVDLELLPAHAPEATLRFPDLSRSEPTEELIAIDDEGGVYRGPDAFIMCLWALTEYREWAERLSSPLLRPLARSAFEMLSNNRARLTRWLGLEAEDLAERLRSEDLGAC